jgi:hypothetical protein
MARLERIPKTRPDLSDGQTVVIVEVRAENQLLMLLPKIVTTPMSNTATSATSSPYSVTAIASSDLKKFRIRFI